LETGIWSAASVPKIPTQEVSRNERIEANHSEC
jgi:hypothetical protein